MFGKLNASRKVRINRKNISLKGECMENIKKIAMKIFHSYEDFYLDKENRKIFEDLFDKYLMKVDSTGKMEIYDAVIKLAGQYRDDYEQMVKTLKEHSLLPE
jgi:hypothetical protein